MAFSASLHMKNVRSLVLRLILTVTIMGSHHHYQCTVSSF